MSWNSPPDLDEPCLNLCAALNLLPGIETTDSCCGHGDGPFRIWFTIHDLESVGAVTLARCLSGRYYSYAQDESRADPEWRAYIADTVGPVQFVLEGQRMKSPSGEHPPAEKLACNLRCEFDFREAKRFGLVAGFMTKGRHRD